MCSVKVPVKIKKFVLNSRKWIAKIIYENSVTEFRMKSKVTDVKNIFTVKKY